MISIKDKNGTILKVNDKLKDKKGIIWKIENIRGLSFVCRYENKRLVQTVILRKFKFNESEKI